MEREAEWEDEAGWEKGEHRGGRSHENGWGWREGRGAPFTTWDWRGSFWARSFLTGDSHIQLKGKNGREQI